jgi:endothelin-converting enzyme/putative endopeptidase
MHLKRVLSSIVLMALAAGAQTGSAPTNKPLGKAAAASVEKTENAEKTVPRPKSFDLGAMDKSVDPCQDFYQYACGTWRKNNPIPPDQSRWGRFNELADYNRQFLHNILEKVSANDPKRTDVQQKIGDMYQSCMDETTVNKKGSTPLKPELDRIAAITTKDQLVDTVAYLQSIGVQAIFNFGSQPDLHNASMEIANIAQGGLGLPDRDYYSDTDAKSQETRQKYLEHVAKMFVLLGDDEAAAQKEAQAVMDIESKLADAAFKRVQMRDPKNRDHKGACSGLQVRSFLHCNRRAELY